MLKNKSLKTLVIILIIVINCVTISMLTINIKHSIGEIQSDNISEQETTNNYTNLVADNTSTDINNYEKLTLDTIVNIILVIIGIILIIISILMLLRLKNK